MYCTLLGQDWLLILLACRLAGPMPSCGQQPSCLAVPMSGTSHCQQVACLLLQELHPWQRCYA